MTRKGKNIIAQAYEISKAFNKHYINIVEKVSETKLMKEVLHQSLYGSDVIDRNY